MNIYKNVIKTYPKYCYLNNKFLFNKKLHNLSLQRTVVDSNHVKCQKFTKRKSYTKTKLHCSTYNSTDIEEIEVVTDLYPYFQSPYLSNSDLARRVLYQNNNDHKIVEIAKCASIEEVFSFVRKNSADLDYKCLTQVILVLSDLQNIFFYHLDLKTEERNNFFKNLLQHHEFYTVINSIERKLDTYDVLFLSYTLLYLNKLGLSVESHLIQNMVTQIKNCLSESKFSLDIAARLLRVVFSENSVRPYFTVVDIIPEIFGEIDLVESVKQMDDLTVCLNLVHNLLTQETMDRYINKVNEFIETNKLTGADYTVVLKIIALLNYPSFRTKSSSHIAKYILLIQDFIELMNFKELQVLYHIFFKCQEPGEVLNTIQRASAKILHEQEDTQLQRNTQLKLFSCLIFFSSPNHRTQFRKDIPKYMTEKETLNNLINLRKIYSYLKISDVKLCELFWSKACQTLKELKEFEQISKLYENYLSFLADNPGYRSYVFESHIISIIEKELDSGKLTMFPRQLFSAFAFALVFCKDFRLMQRLMECFKESKSQINSTDLLKISQVFNFLRQHRNRTVNNTQLTDIRNILNEATEKLYTYYNEDPGETNPLLIKAAVLRNDFHTELIDDIIQDCKKIKYMSSKTLENLCFCLFAPKALVPEVVNKCTEYVIHQKDRIIGFNAEKTLFLCYYLNYYPVYADKFFQTVTDLIIRDQERLSGLSFLQGALSLCYFHRMPKSFIKQIFNVEFLDKLDVELENCYYRDVYPQRVRSTLMQLNRAVCLEYPEYNVPWFHQKYVVESQKMYAKDDIYRTTFQLSIKNYLTGVIGTSSIVENVLTPYGYFINFVIYFDKYNKPTSDLDSNNLKLALLLKNETAFTRFYIRLKGKHELQIRHLEILGYKVKIIKWNDWTNLLYASERIEFIKALVFS